MLRTSSTLLLSGALGIVFQSTPAFAQPVGSGQVILEVQDALGRPLADVSVRLESAEGRVVGVGHTDVAGQVVFTALAAGVYSIESQDPRYQPGQAVIALGAASIARAKLTLAARETLSLKLEAARLERARNGLMPEAGSSVYRFDRKALTSMPQGEVTPVNQVLLQAPGVAQNVAGQIFVRGDHGNVQYRLNGILLPEGISGFGQTLDTRFAERIDLLTGALPAQYGYRTAGVVSVQTKTGTSAPGGVLGFQGGTNGHIEPSLQLGGSSGPLDYYLSGSYLQNNLGLDSPTPDAFSLHNQVKQGKGFGFFSAMLSPTTRASLIMGTAAQAFQIPNTPGQTPAFKVANAPDLPSSNLDANMQPLNHYGVLALNGTVGDATDYQVAAFGRYSSLHYRPDPIGDLLYNGVAADVFRSSLVGGVQGDGAYRLTPAHTLRFGSFASLETTLSKNASRVLPVDDKDQPTSDQPVTILDDNSLSAALYSVYAQDEWQALDQLKVNYGLRFDLTEGFNRTNELSPRLGLVYTLTPQTILHAGYSRYFTPPSTELISLTSIEKFQGTTNAVSTQTNTSVVAERAHYFDVGVLQQLTPALSVGLDAYYKDATDFADVGQFGNALVFSAFNFAQGRIAGAELTGSYRQDDLRAYTNLTLSRSLGFGIRSGEHNFEPEELAHINSNWTTVDHNQAVTISTGASYPIWGVQFDLNGLIGSGLARGFVNSETLPAYGLINAGASRKFALPVFGTVDARLSANNLLDASYLLRDGSGVGVGTAAYGPRRGVFLALTKSF